MKTPTLAAAALLAFAPAALSAQADTAAPASAQAPSDDAAADVLPGATVYDTQGGVVGRIVSVDGEAVVVDSGTSRATLAKSGFAKGSNGPVVGMTKAQFDQAVATAQGEADSKLATALVAGAAVQSSDGVAVGTVKEIDANGNVVLDRPAGVIALPKSQFTTTAAGAVALRFTNADLEAAIARSVPAAPSAG
jgi:preprotein translocase subunit YajC